jgi:hypothetical protein
MGGELPARTSFPLRFSPRALAKVLEVIYRLLATFLAHKAGFTRKEVITGAVTLVPRFGSALNGAAHSRHGVQSGVKCAVSQRGKKLPSRGRQGRGRQGRGRQG